MLIGWISDGKLVKKSTVLGLYYIEQKLGECNNGETNFWKNKNYIDHLDGNIFIMPMTVLSVSADRSDVFGDENGTCGLGYFGPGTCGPGDFGPGTCGPGYFGLEPVALETLDLETLEPEILDLETLDMKTLELEMLDLETLDMKTLELEMLELEMLEMETLEMETLEMKTLEMEM